MNKFVYWSDRVQAGVQYSETVKESVLRSQSVVVCLHPDGRVSSRVSSVGHLMSVKVVTDDVPQ